MLTNARPGISVSIISIYLHTEFVDCNREDWTLDLLYANFKEAFHTFEFVFLMLHNSK